MSQYPLSRQDVDLRDRVGKEAEELVVSGCRGFWKRCEGRGLEKCECFISTFFLRVEWRVVRVKWRFVTSEVDNRHV